jgi:hypothetical protein
MRMSITEDTSANSNGTIEHCTEFLDFGGGEKEEFGENGWNFGF